MEKATQEKKKVIRAKNKEVVKLLLTMVREGKHSKAVEYAKKIFFVQFRKEPLTSAEASEILRGGMKG